MKDSYTHITLVVDRSGSMASTASDAQQGINSTIKDAQNTAGEATLYFTDFDNEHTVVYGPGDIKDYAADYTLEPRNNTALLDAIGRAMVKTGEYLAAKDEADRPAKVVVVIVTDGMENASREWTREAVKHLITTQQEQYNWQIIFIGSNIDAYGTGTKMGVKGQHTTSYAGTGASTQNMYGNTASAIRAFREDSTMDSMPAVASVDAAGNNIPNPGTGKVWDAAKKEWVDPQDITQPVTS